MSQPMNYMAAIAADPAVVSAKPEHQQKQHRSGGGGREGGGGRDNNRRPPYAGHDQVSESTGNPAIDLARQQERNAQKHANRAPRHDHVPRVPEKPKSSAVVVTKVIKKEGEEPKFVDVDFTTHLIIHTTLDDQYVSCPRASAKNIPTLTVPAVPEPTRVDLTEEEQQKQEQEEAAAAAAAKEKKKKEAEEAGEEVPKEEAAAEEEEEAEPAEKKKKDHILVYPSVVVDVANLHAGAFIAINAWIEKKEVMGASTTTFQNPITHTEIQQMLKDEWEQEFAKNLLKSGEAIIGCINFAEKHGMKGLQQFGIVALSCALRGKTAHEMALAMGHNDDSFSEEEIGKGRAAYPNAVQLASPK